MAEKRMDYEGPAGVAQRVILVDPAGNATGGLGALLFGELQQFNRMAVFPGGVGITISATGAISDRPRGVYRLRCITAGTITLHDNASAATGANVGGISALAMTAGQVIEIGELTSAGIFATVASGTYRLVVTE